MALEIYLLGQFKLIANQRLIELPSRPAQSLMAYLALNAGIALRREKLASLLWAESPEGNARSYLRQALWRIRKALESGSLRGEDYLQINEISITFNNQADYWLDVERLLTPDEGRPLEEIIADARLYREELLPGFYDEWVTTERDRIEAAYYQKMDHILQWLVQLKRWDDALQWSEQWIRLGHSPEPAYRALMRAHAGLGNLEMASATYQRCVEALERDLGVDPAPETTRLLEQIRRGALQEASPPPVVAVDRATPPPFLLDKKPPRVVEKPLVVAREPALRWLDSLLDKALSGQGSVAFVTGEAGSGKTTLISEFCRRAQGRFANLIVASGNCNAHTGIGDPYLPFREVMDLLSADIEARWTVGAISREYAQYLWSLFPFTVQALLDAGPDLLDTFVPAAALAERSRLFVSGETDWQIRLERLVRQRAAEPVARNLHQSDLFVQYCKVLQILTRQAPLVLVLDDLQWADVGSISLLFHLGRHLAGDKILIVGAYRPEDVALGRGGERHPLEPVVNELRRLYGENELNIDLAESRAFVDELLDSEPNQMGAAFREMLCGLTYGHPLFTIELLRGMQERGDLKKDGNNCWVEARPVEWERLPARVEAVIGERIGRLEPLLQSILRIASVEGELFTAEVIARVQGRAESEITGWLSGELDRVHRLVRAQSVQRKDGQLISSYRFRHSLVQKFLYSSLDEIERVHLHERVGYILESLYKDHAGAAVVSPQLARHFQEARIDEKAIHYLQQAGERALQVSAYQEAIVHLEAGLALLSGLPDAGKYGEQELSLQLSNSMAWLLARGCPAPGTVQATARALELCELHGNLTQMCQVLTGLSLIHYVKGEHQPGLDCANRGIELGLQVGDPMLLAMGNWCKGIHQYAGGDFASARSYFEQVADYYQPEQHHRGFVFLRGIDAGLSSLAYLSCCLWCLGYPEAAVQQHRQVLEMARGINHSFSLADVLCYGGCELHMHRTLAFLQRLQGDDQGAEASLVNALQVARQQQARFWELRAAVDLARLWREHGRADDGRQLLWEASSGFDEGADIPELKTAWELIRT